MNRERFDHLLEAYGGDFKRWPAEERVAAAEYVAQNPDAAAALEAAKALDEALDHAREEQIDTSGLAARVLAQGPRAEPWLSKRGMLALAACAVFGVVLGYGGGLLAPANADDAYFAAAFEAPLLIGDEG
jgi:hypothetical protein